VYGVGESVTATYSLDQAAVSGDRLRMYDLYLTLVQCQVGMNMANRSATQAPDALDIIQITASGKRLTSIESLLGYREPIALTQGATSVSVRITLNNAALKSAALTKFQPGPLYADEDRFDINGNDVFDGTEAYAAYEHVLSGRCGGLDASGPGTNWFAGIVNDNNEVVQSWQDSPPLRLRLLPNGSPDATPGYARGQALRLNITGLVDGRGYTIYFESDPVLLTAVTAANSGTVTTDVTIPGDAEPGRHHIVVRESGGSEAARLAVDVNADASLGPIVNIPIEGDETTTEPPSAGSAGFGS